LAPSHRASDDCPCHRCTDKNTPLNEDGRLLAEHRTQQLSNIGFNPTLCYYGEYEHTKETACYLTGGACTIEKLQELNPGHEPTDVLEVLAKKLQELNYEHESVEVRAAPAKNPQELNPGYESTDALAALARKLVADGEYRSTSLVIALVGHEPLLGQIVAAVTGKRIRPLQHLDAICVSATCTSDLLRGKGDIEWRFPVRAYEESNLRQKITTKMTAATFLAGFSFTALLGVLLFDKKNCPTCIPLVSNLTANCEDLLFVASALLTFAVVLFVAAIYIYDRLSMPEGFWGTSRAGPWRRITSFSDIERNEYGELYTHMVDAWKFFFTPAVILTAAGFLLIALAVGSRYAAITYIWLFAFGTLYYLKLRPKLGVD
jgi:phosphohistidine phosphatase SixA